MGEHQDLGAHFVMVEEKRNILIGYVLPYFPVPSASSNYDLLSLRPYSIDLGSLLGLLRFSSWKRHFES